MFAMPCYGKNAAYIQLFMLSVLCLYSISNIFAFFYVMGNVTASLWTFLSLIIIMASIHLTLLSVTDSVDSWFTVRSLTEFRKFGFICCIISFFTSIVFLSGISRNDLFLITNNSFASSFSAYSCTVWCFILHSITNYNINQLREQDHYRRLQRLFESLEGPHFLQYNEPEQNAVVEMDAPPSYSEVMAVPSYSEAMAVPSYSEAMALPSYSEAMAATAMGTETLTYNTFRNINRAENNQVALVALQTDGTVPFRPLFSETSV